MQNTLLDSTISQNPQELSNASSAFKLLEDPQFRVRVIMRCAEPWVVATGVATCIEHSDVSAMCKLCRDKDKAVVKVSDESSETQQMSSKNTPNITVISESGLYRIRSSIQNVGHHIGNILEDEELQEDSVISILEITAADGKSYRTKLIQLLRIP